MSGELRPQGTAELLAQTGKLFTSHFPTFAGIAAVPPLYLLCVATPVLFLLVFGPTEGPVDLRAAWMEISPWSKLGVIGVFISFMAVTFVAWCAGVLAASGFYLAEPISSLEAYWSLRERWKGFLWLFVVLGVLCAIPPFILAFWITLLFFALSIPIALLENQSLLVAIRRSRKLSQEGQGHLVSLFVLYNILASLSILVFMFLLGFVPFLLGVVWGGRLALLIGFWFIGLVAQLYMIALTLRYYDQRVRKEKWQPAQQPAPKDSDAFRPPRGTLFP